MKTFLVIIKNPVELFLQTTKEKQFGVQIDELCMTRNMSKDWHIYRDTPEGRAGERLPATIESHCGAKKYTLRTYLMVHNKGKIGE